MSARLVAALLTVAALVSVGLVVVSPGSLRWQAHPGTACEDLRALQQSLDLTSLADQAVIRARAVQLAAALSVEGDQKVDGTVVLSDALRQQVLARLQVVIADPRATSRDLAESLAPLAARCGVELEV